MAASQMVRPAAALAIGNDFYRPPQERLRYCARDAGRLHQRLLELGWPSDSAELKIDLPEDELFPVVESFVQRVRNLAEDTSSHDESSHLLIFLFYAGHAIEKDRTLRLLPLDSDNGLEVESRIVRPLNRIRLSGHRKVVVVLCFDSCRQELDNVTWRSPEAEEDMEALSVRGSGALANKLYMSPNDFLFLWACDPGRVAGESHVDSAGCFTDELLRQLGQDESILDLFTRVQDAVARRTSNRQRPRLDSRLTFPLVLSRRVFCGSPTPTSARRTLTESSGSSAPPLPSSSSASLAKECHASLSLDPPVAELLMELGLQQHEAVLAANEVDMEALKLAAKGRTRDLEALGLPPGPALKIRKRLEVIEDAKPSAVPVSTTLGNVLEAGKAAVRLCPKAQLRGLMVDLLRGARDGRESGFEHLGRSFRQNVRAQVFSFEEPVKYKVTVTDMATQKHASARKACEEEARREALGSLLPQLASSELVQQILAVGIEGIGLNGALRSCIAVDNASLEAAVDWACQHMEEDNFNLSLP